MSFLFILMLGYVLLGSIIGFMELRQRGPPDPVLFVSDQLRCIDAKAGDSGSLVG
jgi:hypothetical protein